MGEMADMELDNMLCAEEDGLFDDEPVGGYNRRRSPPYCRYCGDNDVYWKSLNNRWRLLNSKTHELHTCQEYARAHQRQ